MEVWSAAGDSTYVWFGLTMEGASIATVSDEITCGDTDSALKSRTDKIVNGLKKMVVYESKPVAKSVESVSSVTVGEDRLKSSSETCKVSTATATACDQTMAELMDCGESNPDSSDVAASFVESGTINCVNSVHLDAADKSVELSSESSSLLSPKHSTSSQCERSSPPPASGASHPTVSPEISACGSEESIDAPCINGCDNSTLPKSSSMNNVAEVLTESMSVESKDISAQSKLSNHEGSGDISTSVLPSGIPNSANDNDSTEMTRATKLVNGKPVSLLKTDFPTSDQNEESSSDRKSMDNQDLNGHGSVQSDNIDNALDLETSDANEHHNVDVKDKIMERQNLNKEVLNGSSLEHDVEMNLEQLEGETDNPALNSEECSESEVSSFSIDPCTASVNPQDQDNGCVPVGDRDTDQDISFDEQNQVTGTKDAIVENNLESKVLTDEGKATVNSDPRKMEPDDTLTVKPKDSLENDITEDTNQKCENDKLLKPDVAVEMEDSEVIVLSDKNSSSVDQEEKSVGSDKISFQESKDQKMECNNDSEVATPQKVENEKRIDDTNVIKESKNISSDEHMQSEIDEDDNLDDEILLIDETGEDKLVDYCDQKYSFKNILQKPFHAKTSIDSNDNKEKEKVKDCQDVKTLPMSSSSVISDEEDKKDIKQSSVFNEKTDMQNEVVKKMLDSETEENGEGGKKRGLSVEEAAAPASKRSKLEPSNSDSAENDQKNDASVDEKPEGATTATLMSDAPESLDLDDVVIVTEEKPSQNAVESEVKTTEKVDDNKPLQLTFEALQAVIAARVKVFMASHKQTYLEKLNRRTRGMQSATNLWKETAKHLEKSVLELTVLNQKLEKRKAHANAVKSLASRTIGVQVNEEKVKSLVASVNVNNQPRRPDIANSSAALSLPPSVLLNPSSLQPQMPRQQIPAGVRNRTAIRNAGLPQTPPQAPPNRFVRAPVRSPASSIPAASPQRSGGYKRKILQAQQHNVRPPAPQMAANNVVNLIDLTEEEDIARKTVAQASRSTSSQPSQISSKYNVGGKIASLSSNNCIQQSPVPPGASGGLLGARNSALQQPHITGSQAQLMAPGSGAMNIPGSQYQLVSINNATTPQTGAFIALVPGTRMSGPSSMPAASVGPANISASPKVIPPAPATAAGTAPSASKPAQHSLPPSFHISQSKHPAPLPSSVDSGNAPPSAKSRPPKPGLKISRVTQGIVLSWNMPSLSECEKIASYQLFAYQETDSAIPRSTLWKKVGDVKALPLPMACTLTQFQEGNKYHFAVRAVDQYGRCGAYSDPSTIFLGPKS